MSRNGSERSGPSRSRGSGRPARRRKTASARSASRRGGRGARALTPRYEPQARLAGGLLGLGRAVSGAVARCACWPGPGTRRRPRGQRPARRCRAVISMSPPHRSAGQPLTVARGLALCKEPLELCRPSAPQRRPRGVVAAHAVHAAAGRRRRRAEVDAGRAASSTGRARATGRVKSWRRSWSAAVDVAADVVRVVALELGGPIARAARGRGRGSRARSARSAPRSASVMSTGRAVRDVAVGPACACPAGARVGSKRLCWASSTNGRSGCSPARHGAPRTRRSPRACRRGGRSPARAHSGARHGIGPSSAQSTLKTPGP